RSLRVVEQRAVVDADARLVGLEVFRANETNVVRGDDGHAACARKLHGGIEIGLFAGASSALQLELVAVAKQAEPEIERCDRFVFAPVEQRSADVAFLRSR